MCDCVHEYPTRERAIEGARYEAEYWGFLRKDSHLEKTEDGAVLYFTDENGNRCRNDYKVN